jgi:hypothetical protein
LPVSLYKVKFRVAAGRPFSRFEQLILKAIGAGINRLDELVDLFRVHRRMVVESLVTLMQAGWVSIESSTNQFGLTPNGLEAVKSDHAAPAFVYTDERWQIVVMERVAGQLARGDKVRPETKKALAKVWEAGAAVPKSDIPNIVDPGMVRPLLSGRSGERVRWIGPISAASDNNAFVVVGVDTSTEQITGIPTAWQALLAGELLDRARRRERRLEELGQRPDDSVLRDLIDTDISDGVAAADTYSISLNEEDVAIGEAENAALLARFLERSQSFITIASSTLRGSVVRSLYPILESAIAQNKTISVCWGGVPSDNLPEHKDALKLLEKLQWDSSKGAHGRLTVAVSEGHFSANVLAGDVDGYVEAAVGAHSWLGSSAETPCVSIRLHHAGAVARLCDVMGDYHASDQRLKRGGALTRLRHAAMDLAALAQEGGQSLTADVDVSLVFDGHNQIEFRRLISLARKSITIGCETLTVVSAEEQAMLNSSIDADRAVSVLCRAGCGALVVDALNKASGSEESRVVVQGPVDVPINYAVVDSTRVFISSYRPFTSSEMTQRSFGAEIGLTLSTASSLSWLSDRLAPRQSTA